MASDMNYMKNMHTILGVGTCGTFPLRAHVSAMHVTNNLEFPADMCKSYVCAKIFMQICH